MLWEILGLFHGIKFHFCYVSTSTKCMMSIPHVLPVIFHYFSQCVQFLLVEFTQEHGSFVLPPLGDLFFPDLECHSGGRVCVWI